MKFAAVHRAWLASAAAEAPDKAIAAWVRLAVCAADIELGEGDGELGEGRIPGQLDWGDRAWMRAAGVNLEEIEAAVDAGLARWDGVDLLVSGYDLAGERAIKARRAAGREGGKKGGRPRKPQPQAEQNPEGKAKGNPEGKPRAKPPFLSSPTLPSLPDPPARTRANGAPPLDAPAIASCYTEVTANTDLPTDELMLRPKQMYALTDAWRWCGGDLGKLRAELRRLAADRWLAKKPFAQWVEHLGTGGSSAKHEPDTSDWDKPNPVLEGRQ